MYEESRRDPDAHHAHQAKRRRFLLRFVKKLIDSGMPEAARGASGPGQMACTRMPLGPTSDTMYHLEGNCFKLAPPLPLDRRLLINARVCRAIINSSSVGMT